VTDLGRVPRTRRAGDPSGDRNPYPTAEIGDGASVCLQMGAASAWSRRALSGWLSSQRRELSVTNGPMKVRHAINLERALKVGTNWAAILERPCDGVRRGGRSSTAARTAWRSADRQSPAGADAIVASKGFHCHRRLSLTVNEVGAETFGVTLSL